MSEIVKFEQVESKILNIRNQQVLLDADVAQLYGVETKEVNKAVKNNPNKFPAGYIFELDTVEKNGLVKNFHQFDNLKHSAVNPKAFTEKGLYMLATILKSKQATETTIAIVEAFTKIRELSRSLNAMTETKDEAKQKTLMQESGKIIAEMLDDGLKTTNTETTIEINLAMLKVKHTINKKKE